jgi:hypothetical protein
MVDRLLGRPRAVLGALIVAQVALAVVLGLSVDHNGWVWFQGGDQIVITTTGWVVGQRELPPTELGYLWPVAEAPITWATGPTYVQLLPPLVVLQVLVLGPIALLCVYGIAAQIGGRLLGYWASLLWVSAPFVAIPLFVDRYHERWTEQFLPQALGLTAMSDFPSMVVVLAGALFVVRALEPGRVLDAALAGFLIGAGAALKPPNLLVAAGAVLAFAVARRWREGLVCAVAIAPAVLVLALWKVRGLGEIPAFALDQARVAVGSGPVGLDLRLDRYLDLDVEHWREQMDQLREFFWSQRVAQWAPFAGLIAVLRVRRWAIAALLGGWLAAFLVVKGFSPRATIESGSFWRLLMPAWPAYLLLFASIPLLVPTFARRLGHRTTPSQSRSVPRWSLAVAIGLTAVVPAVAIAAADPVDGPELALTQDDFENFILTSVDDSVELTASRTTGGVRLTWDDDPWRADVFYRVYRAAGASDVECENTDGHPAQSCYPRGEIIATLRDRAYVDPDPPLEATYRIGVGTNWLDDPAQGDVFAFSPPVTVRG